MPRDSRNPAPTDDLPPQIYSPSVVVGDRSLLNLNPNCRIDSFCKLEVGEGITIDDEVHIASYCHLNIGGGSLHMMKGSAAGSGCRIVTGSNVPGYGVSCSAIAATAQFKRSFVVVGVDAVLFVGVTVLPGVIIGRNAVVAAGSVVRCDIPPFEKWGGVPARKIGEVSRPTIDQDPGDESDWVREYLNRADGYPE